MLPRIVIAPDSFKESLSAQEAAEAIAEGVRQARPDADLHLCPIADGGEGFVEALCGQGRGEVRSATVTGPLGDVTEAQWGLLSIGTDAQPVATALHHSAIIEMAQAAGLERVPIDRRNPLRTTTRGVGELLMAAKRAGVRQALIGLGGSATNDGGMGMAQALGFRFFDAEDHEITQHGCGALLIKAERIERPGEPLALSVKAACDVDNPLLGPQGAARTYAAQKGASGEDIEVLERGLAHFAEIIARDLHIDAREEPGAGAAGGLGLGVVAFADGALESGASLVLDALGFDAALHGADLVITGEGAVNAQTLRGKGPWEVIQRARKASVPVLFLAGNITHAPREIAEAVGVTLRAIAPDGTSKAESMRRAGEFLREMTTRTLTA